MIDENTQINDTRGDAGTPELLTVREAYKRLRISKWKLYDLIRSNLLGSVQIGRRRLIPIEAIRSYVQQLQQRESFA
ncbi:excisionase family DNA-binding protein [Streptomyces antibioticus]|uniref:excisionase family DNA-binding protein n=1 Tax=Streptomyces antibioticus TaxID=1890 RepID=UPI00225261B9|nr:helix-turn-helix domain-containing protein [Streptomyces antibioticus]MCX4742792.1 helix-turn-helix domain-containing protein [Streptomyces antibioticus]